MKELCKSVRGNIKARKQKASKTPPNIFFLHTCIIQVLSRSRVEFMNKVLTNDPIFTPDGFFVGKKEDILSNFQIERSRFWDAAGEALWLFFYKMLLYCWRNWSSISVLSLCLCQAFPFVVFDKVFLYPYTLSEDEYNLLMGNAVDILSYSQSNVMCRVVTSRQCC